MNPKMQPIVQAAGDSREKRLVKPQNADKEYEQYIDEEDEQQNLALNVGKSNQHHNQVLKDNLFDVPNKQHADEESYSYYDNQEDHPEVPVAKNQKVISVDKEVSASSQMTPHIAASPVVSPTKLYLFVTAFTIVILYFMFKFVRRRRVVIRYYHH